MPFAFLKLYTLLESLSESRSYKSGRTLIGLKYAKHDHRKGSKNTTLAMKT